MTSHQRIATLPADDEEARTYVQRGMLVQGVLKYVASHRIAFIPRPPTPASVHASRAYA